MVNIISIAKAGVSKAADILGGVKKSITTPIKGVQSFVVPSTFPAAGISKAGAGAVSGAGKIFSSIKSGASQMYRKAVTNPMAGQTIKSGALKLGAGALGVLGTIKAFQTTKAITSGKPLNLIPTKSETLGAISTAYNPPAAIFGALAGTTEKYGGKAIDTIRGTDASFNKSTYEDMLKNTFDKTIPSFPTIDFQMPEMTMPQMSTMSPVSVSPSMIMPSVSVSGGGGGMDLAMLALLLGGGAGYLVGRKRKKKKKKKKKYKRKRRY